MGTTTLTELYCSSLSELEEVSDCCSLATLDVTLFIGKCKSCKSVALVLECYTFHHTARYSGLVITWCDTSSKVYVVPNRLMKYWFPGLEQRRTTS